MSRGNIPDDVRRFISACVPSVPVLEALLLMREERHVWNPELLSRRLYADEDACRKVLDALARVGIALKDGSQEMYRYQPPQELAHTLDALAQCYGKCLVEVTALIHSRVDKRARQLSDAFSWRSDK